MYIYIYIYIMIHRCEMKCEENQGVRHEVVTCPPGKYCHVQNTCKFLHRGWHCSVHYVILHVMLTYTQLYISYCARTSKNWHAVQIFGMKYINIMKETFKWILYMWFKQHRLNQVSSFLHVIQKSNHQAWCKRSGGK